MEHQHITPEEKAADITSAKVSLKDELHAIEDYKAKALSTTCDKLRAIYEEQQVDETKHVAALTSWLLINDNDFRVKLQNVMDAS